MCESIFELLPLFNGILLGTVPSIRVFFQHYPRLQGYIRLRIILSFSRRVVLMFMSIHSREKIEQWEKLLCFEFTNSWAVANSQAAWSGSRAMETRSIKGITTWGPDPRSLPEFEGCIKGGHADAHHKNHLLSLEVDWNGWVGILVSSSLEVAT